MSRICLSILVTLGLGGGCAPAADQATPDEPLPDGVSGYAPAAVGGIPSVVSLQAPFVEVIPSEETPVIDQFGLMFSPRRLVVRVGQAVRFTNSESLAHNVHLRFIASDSTVLNVDTDPGGAVEFSLDQPGGYDVLCDTHPGMSAFIYATMSPYTVIAENDGQFLIQGVPPGTYDLTIWSVDPNLAIERSVELGPGSTQLDLSR